MRILLTGASGFVGSAFVRKYAWARPQIDITAYCHNSAQNHMSRLSKPDNGDAWPNNVRFVFGDLLGQHVSGLCEGIDVVIHCAAKTFVDHSIKDPAAFIQSNVCGTFALLEEARRQGVKRFIYTSTDEVLGPILKGRHPPNAPIRASNPYSASKAAAEALVYSYHVTYGMDVIITRCENLYGPYQHPQKVFPTFIGKAMRGEKLPVYGDGMHKRQWLWVDDKVEALRLLCNLDFEWECQDGTWTIPSSWLTSRTRIVHIAGCQESTNFNLAKEIIVKTSTVAKPWEEVIEHIPDQQARPGHDRRYAIEPSPLLADLGWKPKVTLEEGIDRLVSFCLYHPEWLR